MPPLRLVVIAFIVFAVGSLAISANETPTQVKSLTLIFLDDTGKPIPKAKFSYWGEPKPHDASGYRKYTEADENGRFVVEFKSEKPQKSLVFIIESSGYAPFHAGWGNDSANIVTDPIPAEYTVKLEKAATVGGIVLGDDGKPLSGVSVEFSVPWGNRARIRQPDHYVCGCRSKTDENGIWKYESVPADVLDSDAQITFTHSDYMRKSARFKLASLMSSDKGTFLSIKLEHGIMIKGRVTDTDGKPVPDAVVIGKHDENQYGRETTTKTDENGEYTFKNWAESQSAFVGVWKAGMMAALKNFPVSKENPSIDFMLKPAGKPVAIKIVDKAGKPIKGFYIAIERWGVQRMPGSELLTGKDRPRTDENGTWTWKEAPEEEIVFDMFLSENYMDVRQKSVVPRDEEYVFVSGDPLEISGNVTDAETGKTIPAFNVYFGRKFSNSTQIHWDIKRGAGGNGTYKIDENYAVNVSGFAVKIEAEGYETAISRDIAFDEGSVTFDAALKKLSADKTSIRGIVLTVDGEPVADVDVAIALHSGGVSYIPNGRLDRSYAREPYIASTDKEGRFKFMYIDFETAPQQQVPPGWKKIDYILLFLHASGFKRLTQQDWEALGENKTVTLEPWGRIEGTVKVGTQPGKNLPIQGDVSFSNEQNTGFRGISEPHVTFSYSTTADESGTFAFDRVPASFVTVSRTAIFNDSGQGHSSTSSHSADKIELKPGETATVALGGVGRPVIGKLIPASEFEAPPDWRFSHIECTPMGEKAEFPEAAAEELRNKLVPKELLEEKDPMKQRELSQAWFETEDGTKFKAAMEELTKDYDEAHKRNWEKRTMRRVCAVAKDGTFQLDDIFEGDWTLKVTLDSPPPPGQICGVGAQLGTLERKFFVTAVPSGVSNEPLDLDSLEIRYAPSRQMPKVGEAAPEFELPKIVPIAANGAFEDKGMLHLSDYKGKHVILDFWAMWCGPCLDKLPEIKTLYEKIKDDDRFVLIGISLDPTDSPEKLGKFLSRLEVPWVQGLSGGWDSDTVRVYGVQAIPALLLIDSDGKVLLSNPDMTELAKTIDELRGQ